MLDKAPSHCVLVGGHTRNFIQVLQRSIFCAVVPGNGWAHIEEPVIHGCIPVVVMDGIHVQLEGVLDVSRFALRFSRNEIPGIVDKLRAIPDTRIAEMQAEIAKVWERYTYSGLFKRELAMQKWGEASEGVAHARSGSVSVKQGNASLRTRLGSTTGSDTAAFAPVEPRLRGRDAVGALIELLGLRLQARSNPSVDVKSIHVDHGPSQTMPAPIPGYRPPKTSGVQ